MNCHLCRPIPDSVFTEAIYQESRYVKLYIQTNTTSPSLRITADGYCPDNAHCGMRGVPVHCILPIKFCPECGTKLEKIS